MSSINRKLKVFLCHASYDKPVVYDLWKRLISEGWVDPWLDAEKLIPGQDWDFEIEKAVEAADAVVVCISNNSVNKEGYVQKELRSIINVALEKPPETIFIIPLRLDECPVPRSIKHIHYFDYFPSNKVEVAYNRLLGSLKARSNLLGIDIEKVKEYYYKKEEEKVQQDRIERIRKEAREKARHEEELIIRQDAEEHARIEILSEVRKLVEEGKRKEAEDKRRQEKELIQKKTEELFQYEMDLLRQKRGNAEANERKKRKPDEAEESSYSPSVSDTYNSNKRNSSAIMPIIVILVLCCICAVISIGWFYGDAIIQSLGM